MNDEAAPPALHVLGVSEAPFEVSTRETLAEVCLSMASQARRTLDIVSRHLDAPLYDNDAFAGSETVGFDDDWGALRTNVSFRCVDFGKGLLACGRDCVAFQKVFGKRFRPFEFRCCFARSEAG